MRALRPEERAAIAAVSRHFSATWRAGRKSPATLRLNGRRIAVELCLLDPPRTMDSPAAKPRLRYDRVALRFIRDLREQLVPQLARREVAIATIRAPILQAGKTLQALEEKFRARRAGNDARTELTSRVFGNRIDLRLLHGTGRGSDVLGFVYTEGTRPAVIADAVQSLLVCLRPRSDIPRSAGADRWLVVRGALAFADAYRDACTQLSNLAPFANVVLVAEDGRVETLGGRGAAGKRGK